MNRVKQHLVKSLVILVMMFLPMGLIGQEFLDGVCRIENGRLVFKIDLNWTREQIKNVSGKFDLDTILLVKAIKGEADSILLAGGWQWKKINSRTAELSKLMGQEPPGAPITGKVVEPAKIFLMDDAWMLTDGMAEPEQADYGVNNLLESSLFTYSDSIARFILNGFPNARQVYLSGTFNEWATSKTPMKLIGNQWTVNLPLKPGKYAYKFIVDGRWTQDPNNKLREDDLNGGYNSVIFCYNFRFFLPGFSDAKRVYLAGSFNDFNPKELSMHAVAGGWELLLFLRPGTHAYKYVIDGRWITDPVNKVVRPDGRGNFNSFLGIGDTTWFRLAGFESAHNVILSGSFNGWNTSELVMEKTAVGWQLPYILSPGNYEYKFIADGRWMNDPGNPHVNGGGNQPNSLLVVKPNHTFVVKGLPNAKQVGVSGSFNGWNKQGYRMAHENNQWTLPLYLKPGKYTYKIVVDGKMILDPGNKLWEENEFGTGNSVLWIER